MCSLHWIFLILLDYKEYLDSLKNYIMHTKCMANLFHRNKFIIRVRNSRNKKNEDKTTKLNTTKGFNKKTAAAQSPLIILFEVSYHSVLLIYWYKVKTERKKKELFLNPVLVQNHMTRFWVFGGGWVQSITFLGSFRFHNYLVFLLVFMQTYISGMKKITTHFEILHAITLISHP